MLPCNFYEFITIYIHYKINKSLRNSNEKLSYPCAEDFSKTTISESC